MKPPRGSLIKPWHRHSCLCLFLLVAYHSNLRPVASGDSLPGSLIPFSILFDHTITLNRFAPWINQNVPYSPGLLRQSGGDWYSIYPIAGPVLATPLYVPALLFPRLRSLPPESLIATARIAEKFTAAFITSLAALWMLVLLGRIVPPNWAWALTLIFALGTGTWSTSSQAMWQHTFGQVAIIGCLYFLDRREYLWCGIAVAVAVMVRPTNVLLVPAVAAALWTSRTAIEDWTRVFAPVSIGAVITALYNWRVFGDLTGGYPAGLSGDFLEGLSGILVSPGRGLLIYTPVAIFALAAVYERATREHRGLLIAASLFSLLQIVTIAKWPIWWGGYCWGPRLLTEILPCLMVLIAIGKPSLDFRVAKAALAVVAVYGVFIQALGVYCYPKGRWDHVPISVNQRPARLWDWRDNPIRRTARGGVVWEPFEIVKTAIKEGLPAAANKLKDYGINPF